MAYLKEVSDNFEKTQKTRPGFWGFTPGGFFGIANPALKRFDNFWRIRVSMLRVVLLDLEGEPLQSQGDAYGEEVSVFVRFPTMFNDTDSQGNKFLFLSQKFICEAEYTYAGGEDRYLVP